MIGGGTEMDPIRFSGRGQPSMALTPYFADDVHGLSDIPFYTFAAGQPVNAVGIR